jgi:hypothetical protein
MKRTRCVHNAANPIPVSIFVFWYERKFVREGSCMMSFMHEGKGMQV